MTGWLSSLLQQVVEFAGNSPTTVGLILAFAAGAEAVIVVGALFPGEAMVLAVAAAAGIAGLDAMPLVLWTTAGAIIGDGISFWIGHKYGHNISNWSYLKKHPGLLQSGEAFIARHGVKSIIIARFLPGLRAIVPVAAGVLKMPPLQFYVANVISAILWSITHILPAVGLGIAFNTLGAVSGRLTLLVGFSFIALVLIVWLIRVLISFAGPPLVKLYARLIGSLGQLPFAPARSLAHWLDPRHPHLPGMAFWAGSLLLSAGGFLWVLEHLVGGDPLVSADVSIGQFMQSLRTEPLEGLMLTFSAMGDLLPLAAAALALLALLLLQRAYLIAAWAALTIAAATLFVPLIKLVLQKPRPVELSSGFDVYGFPSGHTTMSTVIFSVLAVLVARKLPLGGKLTVYTIAVLWVGLVGLSRVYLSAHWPSDVLGGLLFGAALTAVFAMLVSHLDVKSYSRAGLAAGVVAVFLAVGLWHANRSSEHYATLYAPRVVLDELSAPQWTSKAWREYPRGRVDIRGVEKEPFQLQWAGPEPALAASLSASGWRRTEHFTWRDWLSMLLPRAALADFPPLPRLHNGLLPVATYVFDRPQEAGLPADQRLVLRVWATNTVVRGLNGEKTGRRLLLAALRRERLTHPFGMASVLQPLDPTSSDEALFARTLDAMKNIVVARKGDDAPALAWPK